MSTLFFYKVDMKLVRDYSKIDDNVMSVSPQNNKMNRPFLGVIVMAGGYKYCVPLSSPKPKHEKMKNSLDFFKIYDKSKKDSNNKYKLIGILNINNMIPVSEEFIQRIDLKVKDDNSKEIKVYKELMQKQLDYCRENEEIIIKKVNKLYKLITQEPEKKPKLTKRTVDFRKLERKLDTKRSV